MAIQRLQFIFFSDATSLAAYGTMFTSGSESTYIPPESVCDHLHQFGHLAGLPQFTHSFLQVIWHACGWVLWKERNNKIFNHKAKDLVNLLDIANLFFFVES